MLFRSMPKGTEDSGPGHRKGKVVTPVVIARNVRALRASVPVVDAARPRLDSSPENISMMMLTGSL